MSRQKIDDVEARQGETRHNVRWILAFSLAAAVAVLVALLLIYT